MSTTIIKKDINDLCAQLEMLGQVSALDSIRSRFQRCDGSLSDLVRIRDMADEMLEAAKKP